MDLIGGTGQVRYPTGCFKKTARIENMNRFANISASVYRTKSVLYLKRSYGCQLSIALCVSLVIFFRKEELSKNHGTFFFKFKQNLVTKANDGILVHRKSSKICFYGLYRVIL